MKLAEFAYRVLKCSRDGGDADGASIQEWAEECGLITPQEVTEPCGEFCYCEEYSGFPTTCYFDSSAFEAALRSDQLQEVK